MHKTYRHIEIEVSIHDRLLRMKQDITANHTGYVSNDFVINHLMDFYEQNGGEYKSDLLIDETSSIPANYTKPKPLNIPYKQCFMQPSLEDKSTDRFAPNVLASRRISLRRMK